MNETRHRFDYDVAILGGGSAGYAAARMATATGLQTVVIEGGAEVGGLCILRGCMPTKALLYAAEVLHRVQHAEPWGIHAENVGFDFAKVMARKKALIKSFADDRREHQLPRQRLPHAAGVVDTKSSKVQVNPAGATFEMNSLGGFPLGNREPSNFGFSMNAISVWCDEKHPDNTP